MVSVGVLSLSWTKLFLMLVYSVRREHAALAPGDSVLGPAGSRGAGVP